MRAAIYNPYLDTLGGGERYTLTLVEFLVKKGYEVYIQWKESEIINILSKRFSLNLDGVKVTNDIGRGDGYDLCFWVSDGSIPSLRARRNFLHFQIPFHDVNGSSLINKMKLWRIEQVICNSYFTKKFIDAEYGINSSVIYPPVDTHKIKPKRKEDIILSVGRFSRLMQSKNQDLLVSAYKKLYDRGNKTWRLVLAGGTEIGNDNFTEELEKMAHGYPVEIIKSPDFRELSEIYGKSKIFWSASGFGEDETYNPEKTEHFGISVVEAMSAGSVPLVFGGGGTKEIINEPVNGFFWDMESELLNKTTLLLADKHMLKKMSNQALTRSKDFSTEIFFEEFNKIL